jgi:hypothetical protein
MPLRSHFNKSMEEEIERENEKLNRYKRVKERTTQRAMEERNRILDINKKKEDHIKKATELKEVALINKVEKLKIAEERRKHAKDLLMKTMRIND